MTDLPEDACLGCHIAKAVSEFTMKNGGHIMAGQVIGTLIELAGEMIATAPNPKRLVRDGVKMLKEAAEDPQSEANHWRGMKLVDGHGHH